MPPDSPKGDSPKGDSPDADSPDADSPQTDSPEVRITTLVAAPPAVAFAAFTDEVDQWWRPGVRYRRLADSRVRFTDRLLLEENADTTRVIARVTRRAPPDADTPGTLDLDMDGDPVRITFAADPSGTRVTVVQRAGRGLTAFQSPAALFWADLLASLERAARPPTR